jgi:Leucine-rich repeat (LRR) protein
LRIREKKTILAVLVLALDSVGTERALRVLRLVATGIRRLPSSITALENLEYLETKRCHQLVGGLPEGIGSLTKLKELDLHNYRLMLAGIGKLTALEKLDMFCVETDKNMHESQSWNSI